MDLASKEPFQPDQKVKYSDAMGANKYNYGVIAVLLGPMALLITGRSAVGVATTSIDSNLIKDITNIDLYLYF